MPMISSVCGVMETGDAAEPRQRDADMEEEDELRLVDVTSRIRQFQQTIRRLAEWAGPSGPGGKSTFRLTLDGFLGLATLKLG